MNKAVHPPQEIYNLIWHRIGEAELILQMLTEPLVFVRHTLNSNARQKHEFSNTDEQKWW